MPIAEVGSGSQRAGVHTPDGVGPSLAFPGNVGAENLLLFAHWGWSSGASNGDVMSVTDTRKNLWTSRVNYNGVSPLDLNIFWAIANGAGADTITSAKESTSYGIGIDEFSGVDPIAPFHVRSTQQSGTSASPTVTITTLVPDCLIVSVFTHSAPTVGISAVSGTLIYKDEDNTTSQAGAAQFHIVGPSGLYTETFSTAGSVTWTIAAVAFKPYTRPTPAIAIPRRQIYSL